jgi:hypothetical protein
MSAGHSIDEVKMRAWWSHRQGLDGSLEGKSAAAVLQRSGWARSVGGVGPYLTLFSRAGIGREEADAAVARLEIHELPSARGCTYVVPASDFAIALKVARALSGEEMKTAAKLGVTEKEIDKLCDAVLKALAKGPLDPDGIRDATGSASRSLGEEGKRKGLTTTLPIALGRLQVEGHIRRVPTNGRLDQQRYQYTLWKPSPMAGDARSEDDAYESLARRFFRWVGPARLAEFQWFSGLGAKAVKEVVASLKLVPIGPESDRLLLPDEVDAFHSFKVPAKPHFVLVSSLDALSATRREVETLVASADRQRKVQIDKKVGPLGGFYDLPNHAIFDRGRLIGLWEYDTESQSIVWVTFGIRDKMLDAAVKNTEAYVRDQLGDARSMSLDSPKTRAPRIQALRKQPSLGQ